MSQAAGTTTPGRIGYEVNEGIAWITFDRSEARNALSATMYTDLVRTSAWADEDPAVRAIVFSGRGGNFVAGADIGEFLEFQDGEDGLRYEERQRINIASLAKIAKPTISAVDGYAVGGGMSIASVSDIRICTKNANFGYPTARTIGNCLDVHGYALLVAMVGEPRAKDLLIQARMMGAEEALACGYVSEIVSENQLLERAGEIARRVARNAPLTIYAAKESIRRIREVSLPSTDDIIQEVYGSEDFREGVLAFSEKRRPRWRQ